MLPKGAAFGTTTKEKDSLTPTSSLDLGFVEQELSSTEDAETSEAETEEVRPGKKLRAFKKVLRKLNFLKKMRKLAKEFSVGTKLLLNLVPTENSLV